MNKTKLVAGLLSLATLTTTITSCGDASHETKEAAVEYNTENPKSMVEAVAQASGGMNKLKSLKDVSYDYNYLKPDGNKDVSVEKYIFEGEASWARYTTHQVNVPETLEGDVVQFYDGKTAFASVNGVESTDPSVVGTGEFLRRANHMWFTMMFKLADPGTTHEYQGKVGNYDAVKVSYDPAVTGKEQNDTYILHINPETKMVEEFFFSLPAFEVNAPVLKAICTYTEIDGIQVMTKREMLAPNPETGEMGPMLTQEISNVKFNTGLTVEGLKADM